jgi:hypothetical protein
MTKLKSLVKADLSYNGIHFLPTTMDQMQKLEVLLLDNNKLVGWRQLELVASAQSIRLLNVHSNPCTTLFDTRNFVISSMPNLSCLDNLIVMDYERYPQNTAFALLRFKPKKQEFRPFGYSPDIKANLYFEHYHLRRAFERTSPIVTIQKTFRMHMQIKKTRLLRSQLKLLWWACYRYFMRRKFLKCIAYHKDKKRQTTRTELFFCGCARRI